MNISNGEVVSYMEKYDYQETIDKQIGKLEDIQEKRTLCASEACEISRTIESLLGSRLKYEKFSK
jgi:hypothetical protein